jgi:plasmid stabilization system protein ParE
MAVVNWSSEARQDLRDLRDYYESRSPAYAQRVIGELFEAASRLEAFPRIGRQVPELESATFREVIVEEYRLVSWCAERARKRPSTCWRLRTAGRICGKKLSRRN